MLYDIEMFDVAVTYINTVASETTCSMSDQLLTTDPPVQSQSSPRAASGQIGTGTRIIPELLLLSLLSLHHCSIFTQAIIPMIGCRHNKASNLQIYNLISAIK
jgi:hypothetical protein